MLHLLLDLWPQVPPAARIVCARRPEYYSKNGLQEKLFSQVVVLLMERGLILKKGTIVDSTIISAPSSTKNKDKQRDPDAHQVKKGNTWHFGYKAHVGVDKDSGIVHTIKVTAANQHDVSMTSELLTGEETVVYGDSGYLGAEKREDAVKKNKNGKRIRYKINRRPSQIAKKSTRSQGQLKRREREKSSIRAKVEHVPAARIVCARRPEYYSGKWEKSQPEIRKKFINYDM